MPFTFSSIPSFPPVDLARVDLTWLTLSCLCLRCSPSPTSPLPPPLFSPLLSPFKPIKDTKIRAAHIVGNIFAMVNDTKTILPYR